MRAHEVQDLIKEAAARAATGAQIIGPQPGPQETFLSTPADIAVYGGAAGAGKSYALLVEPLRHIANPRFSAVVFRREYPQITNAGGLWDTACEIYPRVGAKAKESILEWRFPSGARIKFAHMQHEKNRHQWDGSQIPFLGFDQLESFTWNQFQYMLSRNRSTCGVKPYIRATCNPDPDHFLRHFMRWWIDGETGLPIPERGGRLRWFIVLNDEVHWADTPDELKQEFGKKVTPKSFTFVPGKLEDNRILTDADPGYEGLLNALSNVMRQRLKEGNWNIRETAGEVFRRHWFKIVNAAPTVRDDMRYWDRASTEVAENVESSASWTAGCRMGLTDSGLYVVKHMVRFRKGPLGVKEAVVNTATQDGKRVRVGIEQDPGQAGVVEAKQYVRDLAGFVVHVNKVHESKGVRARPYSAQCEAGNVIIVAGDWNEDFLREHENFTAIGKCVNDQVDSASGAFYMLTENKPISPTWGRK